MILNDFGTIAYQHWEKLPERFSNVELDVFQIMPNHMHGIIVLTPVGAGFTPARNSFAISDDPIIVNNDGARVNRAPTIGDIIGAYKSLVSNDCLEQFKINHLNAGKELYQIPMMGKLLQRNYWEHIIRNETSYKRIADYIINNPDNWKGDKFYNE